MPVQQPRTPRAAGLTRAAVATGALLVSLAGPVVAGDALETVETASDRSTEHDATRASLTSRELQVVSAFALGLGREQVLARLGIAANTLKNHITTINRKLGSEDARHAVLIAYGLGMIELPRQAAI